MRCRSAGKSASSRSRCCSDKKPRLKKGLASCTGSTRRSGRPADQVGGCRPVLHFRETSVKLTPVRTCTLLVEACSSRFARFAVPRSLRLRKLDVLGCIRTEARNVVEAENVHGFRLVSDLAV